MRFHLPFKDVETLLSGTEKYLMMGFKARSTCFWAETTTLSKGAIKAGGGLLPWSLWSQEDVQNSPERSDDSEVIYTTCATRRIPPSLWVAWLASWKKVVGRGFENVTYLSLFGHFPINAAAQTGNALNIRRGWFSIGFKLRRESLLRFLFPTLWSSECILKVLRKLVPIIYFVLVVA